MAYVKNNNSVEVGEWVTTNRKVDSCAGYFEKGTRVKVIGVSERGYDLMNTETELLKLVGIVVASIKRIILWGEKMKLREFLNMYDNWNGIVCVNDNNIDLIVKGKPDIVLSYKDTYTKEVVSFGFYDNELCVRVR